MTNGEALPTGRDRVSASGARWVYVQLLVLAVGSALLLLVDNGQLRLALIAFVLGLPFSISSIYAMLGYSINGGTYSGLGDVREIFYFALPVVLNVLLLWLAVRGRSTSASTEPNRLLGRRLAARILDLIVYQIGVLVVFKMVPSVDGITSIASPWQEAVEALYLVMGPVVLEPILLNRFGATPGKRACGLRVVTVDAGRPSPIQALSRAMGAFTIGLIPYLGCVLSCLFRQPLCPHDRLAGTSVVQVSRLPERTRVRRSRKAIAGPQ